MTADSTGPGPWFPALRIAWNFARAHRLNRRLQRAYPCGRCGYHYDCPAGEYHS